jgi:hypothetical protein
VAGVRGTEFRVGYAPDKQWGQVEVLAGAVAVAGVNDSQTQLVTKGQGVPIDGAGKAMRIEPLSAAPLVERTEMVNRAQSIYAIKLSSGEQTSHYIVQSAQRANLLGAPRTQTLHSAELMTGGLSQEVTFYKLASVSRAGLVGDARQYGFCAVAGGAKAQQCRAVFEAPLSDGVMIAFSLMRQDAGATQELISTSKLQARNGHFVVEGLPAGQYTWRMSYLTAQADVDAPSSVTQQFGHFDLITLPEGLP